MIETVENLRWECRIPREEQDEFAVRSHRRAAAAQAEGRFAEELVPVMVRGRKGDTVIDRDEHIRPDSTVEVLARLRPIMGRDDPEPTVNAGNASGQNDGLLTMAPEPWSRISRSSCLRQFQTPRTSMAITRSKTALSVSAAPSPAS